MARIAARVVRQSMLYVALDVVCIGVGMGVPILSILLGVLVGWRVVRVLGLAVCPMGEALGKVLLWAGVTAGLTLIIMGVIWGGCLPMLFDPSVDVADFGMPLILFEPRASFLGWLGLMIVVSPVLQFLMTLLGAHVALLRVARSGTVAAQ